MVFLALALCPAVQALAQDAGQPLYEEVEVEGEEESVLEYLGWGDAFLVENMSSEWMICIIWNSTHMLEIENIFEVSPFSEVVYFPESTSDTGYVGKPLPDRVQLSGSKEINAICIYDCLAAGTLVHTGSGPRPVEELTPEDLALDPLQPGFTPRVKITKSHTRRTVTLSFDDESLTLTGGHRVATAEGGWTRADRIAVGAKVLAGADGVPVRVTDVAREDHASPIPIYSIRFQAAGSIRVGESGFRVEAPAIESRAQPHTQVSKINLAQSFGPTRLVDVQCRLRAQRSRRVGTPFWSSLACRP